MARPKKKKHTGLIITIIISAVVLLAAVISLLIFQPWNSDSTSDSVTKSDEVSKSNKTSKNNKGGDQSPIDVDDSFISEIKGYKYQPLKKTKDYSLTNFITRQPNKSDGNFILKAPNEWLEDEYESTEYKRVFRPNNKTRGRYVLNHSYTFETKPGEEEQYDDSVEEYSAQDILEKQIEFYTDSIIGEAEVIEEYQKNINGFEYQIAILKENISSNDEPMMRYNLIYTRVLDDGPLKRSILLAEAEFFDPRTLNKEEMLDGIGTFENVLGTFDESKLEKESN